MSLNTCINEDTKLNGGSVVIGAAPTLTERDTLNYNVMYSLYYVVSV